jgi:hypothetical protein
MHHYWQDVDERCHLCHSWRDIGYRIIAAMTAAALGFIVIGGSWVLAILGGLGVGGMGKDSRQLGERETSEERGWRSLLSR